MKTIDLDPPVPRRLGLAAARLSAAMAADAAQHCDLRVASGPTGKVYEQIVRDMRSTCGDAASRCARSTPRAACRTCRCFRPTRPNSAWCRSTCCTS